MSTKTHTATPDLIADLRQQLAILTTTQSGQEYEINTFGYVADLFEEEYPAALDLDEDARAIMLDALRWGLYAGLHAASLTPYQLALHQVLVGDHL